MMGGKWMGSLWVVNGSLMNYVHGSEMGKKLVVRSFSTAGVGYPEVCWRWQHPYGQCKLVFIELQLNPRQCERTVLDSCCIMANDLLWICGLFSGSQAGLPGLFAHNPFPSRARLF